MIPVLILLGILILFLLWAAKKGHLGNYSAGVGNALFQIHTLTRPSAHKIVEARKERKKENKQGDDGPPELPPWAQTG